MSEPAEITEQAPETSETPTETQVVPVEAAPPRETIAQITPRQPVIFENDKLDKRFETARQAIESDEILSPAEKQIKLLEVDMMHEQRQERRQQTAKSEEEHIRDGYASQYKTDRKTVDAKWNEAVSESVRRRGSFDYGTAMTVFEDRMEAAKAPSTPTPLADPKPVGQTRIAPRGVRQAAPPADKKLTVQEMLDRAAQGDMSAIPADVMAEARQQGQ